MRTNIILDDTLISQAMKAGPFKSKKETVEAGLRLLVRRAGYRDILNLRGKLHWDDTAVTAGQFMAESQAHYEVAAPDNPR